LYGNVGGLLKNVGGLLKNVGGLIQNVGGLLQNVGGLLKNAGGLLQNVGDLLEYVVAQKGGPGAASRSTSAQVTTVPFVISFFQEGKFLSCPDLIRVSPINSPPLT
jgi:hypothetical protein